MLRRCVAFNAFEELQLSNDQREALYAQKEERLKEVEELRERCLEGNEREREVGVEPGR